MIRPNIIVITADQWAARDVGCYGSPVPSTPTIDWLAAQGMVFDRCYTNAAVCGPNRACLLTGRSPSVHGVVTNNLELSADIPTFPRLLRDHGYVTGGFGKFHQTSMKYPLPTSLPLLGFSESITTEDPKCDSWLQWIRDRHPQHYETAFALCWPRPWWDEETTRKHREACEKILVPLAEKSRWHGYWESPLAAELHQTSFITDCALSFLERQSKSGDEPFLCNINYVDPHDPYDPPQPYARMFSPSQMPLPVPRAWSPEQSPALVKCGLFRAVLPYARRKMHFNDVADDLTTMAEMRAHFHGSVKFIDDQVALIVEKVRQGPLAGNTVILFTTDHGDMLGDQGLINKGDKHFDRSIRVPLVVWGKGITPGRSKELVSTVDITATICDLAGIVDLPPIEGRSLVTVLEGGAHADPRSETAVESPLTDRKSAWELSGTNVRSMITADGLRLTVYDDPATTSELYDLIQDPDEQHNLFNDQGMKDTRTALLERMQRLYMEQCALASWRNLPQAGLSVAGGYCR